jgi:hypothetical protein
MARPLAYGQFTFLAIAFACLVQAFLTSDFSVLYVAQNSNTLLPDIYKVSAVWGGHEGSLLLWVLFMAIWGAAVAALSKQSAAGRDRARDFGPGHDRGRLPAVHAADVQSLRAPVPDPARGPRPQPAAAGLWSGHPPADALHGLRRLLGRLRLRHRRADRRSARRRLGALVAALDHGRLGVPDHRHRARLLVGLLRTRLGRLVVLGPGRERVADALAGGHRA